MKKRLYFKCWNCRRKYSLFMEINNHQELIVPCPYCNEEGVVKLETYPKKKIPLLRGNPAGEQAVGYEYQFPDVIPTQKPD